ncbi:MAG: hypothetical protein A2Z04_06690 [Chloroflexi bacterium RBG_16_57_9]|nr:MAG: hypothetical protein A2Z04_06690 [Chloroflexi bacterium RBG_16_57_9]
MATFCQNPDCGQMIPELTLQKHPRQRWCSLKCWRNDPRTIKKFHAMMKKRNKQMWTKWRAAGIDPAHGGQAAIKRGAKITTSNREKPRRQKR